MADIFGDQEGDIIQKGYQKRRTQLLSQHGLPDAALQQKLGELRIHNPDEASSAPNHDPRAASLAALRWLHQCGSGTRKDPKCLMLGTYTSSVADYGSWFHGAGSDGSQVKS